MGLSPQQSKSNHEDLLDIINNCFKDPPEIKQRFIEFLNESDFWRAPASTVYHESFEGGLAAHSLKVYENLSLLNYIKVLGFSEETVAKVSILHDLCKVNFYRKTIKNKRMEDGTWVRVEGFEVNDQFPMGHGEKSAIVALQYHIKLTEEELLAIRWHMGAYGPESKDYIAGKSLSNAMTNNKLVVALQLADMMSTYL